MAQFNHPELGGVGQWSQGGMRYAYFSDTSRLAIQHGGRLTVYETGDHRIFGVSQQQGTGT